MKTHRLKHSFSSGELSPLMDGRVDFSRFVNGCKKLKNMVCRTQGPASRREGFRFIADITSYGLDVADPQVRLIPFIFNEAQAYVLVFFMHTDGTPRVLFADEEGLITETANPSQVVILPLTPDWEITNFDWAQSADEIYVAQSGLSPRVIRRLAVDDWETATLTFADVPVDWSVHNGYPETVTFHQQRLAFGANLTRPQTVWMSKAGSFLDFGVSSPLVDSDAITFTLDSGTQNKIAWMVSAKSLNIGTIGNEWTVSGATSTALTPNNILAQRQTNNGSEKNKPLLVGVTTLFVEKHGRSINEFVYDFTFDSYKTSDMAILSLHLTENFSIIDWTYQQTPGSVIWSVREDGDLLGITYQREHEVIGWHQHDTQGKFKAITSVPGITREDEVWTLINRTIDGNEVYYLEKMANQFVGEESVDGQFLDSFLEYNGVPTALLVGADHLANELVSILADGTVHPDVAVSASGEIPLNAEYSRVIIGLPYIPEIWPNLPDIANQTGTSEGRMQQIVNLDLDFYKTVGVTIGRLDSEDGQSEEFVPFRTPANLTGQAVPLNTGIIHYNYEEGWDRDSVYYLKQTQPLPFTIRSIVDTVQVNE